MSRDVIRFRIKPEHVEHVLAMLRNVGITPVNIDDRLDGEVGIEIAHVTDEQGQQIATEFRPEWSAIIGIVGAYPRETRH